ncbi:MAG: hypothetical protein M1820_003052 [Bogoriella megaspora]|nr:MAG: hypothetical protein M1820_003052 [Bogoriella megaspora]
MTLNEKGDMTMNPVSTDSNQRKTYQQTYNQHESPLMQLPSELRRMIWEEVIGGNLFHIVRCPKRLLGIQCPETANAYPGVFERPCWGAVYRPGLIPPVYGKYRSVKDHSDAASADILPILQTCRLIYSETVDLLYQDNVFAFDHLDAALNLRQTTLKCRWNAIRTVCLQWRFRYPFETLPSPSLHNEETCSVLRGPDGAD